MSVWLMLVVLANPVPQEAVKVTVAQPLSHGTIWVYADFELPASELNLFNETGGPEFYYSVDGNWKKSTLKFGPKTVNFKTIYGSAEIKSNSPTVPPSNPDPPLVIAKPKPPFNVKIQ